MKYIIFYMVQPTGLSVDVTDTLTTFSVGVMEVLGNIQVGPARVFETVDEANEYVARMKAHDKGRETP